MPGLLPAYGIGYATFYGIVYRFFEIFFLVDRPREALSADLRALNIYTL